MPENIPFRNNLNLFLHQHFSWPPGTNLFLIPLSSTENGNKRCDGQWEFLGQAGEESRSFLLGSIPTSHPVLYNTCLWAGTVTTPILLLLGSNLLRSWNEAPPSLALFSPGCASLAEGTTPGAVTASWEGLIPPRGGAVRRDSPLVPTYGCYLCKAVFSLMKNISSNCLSTHLCSKIGIIIKNNPQARSYCLNTSKYLSHIV